MSFEKFLMDRVESLRDQAIEDLHASTPDPITCSNCGKEGCEGDDWEINPYNTGKDFCDWDCFEEWELENFHD